MTKSLQTLKRLHRTHIDDCKEQLAMIMAQIGQIELQIAAVKAQAESEVLAASVDPIAASMMGAYMQQVRLKLNALHRDRGFLMQHEDQARDALAAAFLEEKKVELLLDAAEARETAQRAAAEAAVMDEVAISRASRKG